jgi:hypothetical protein
VSGLTPRGDGRGNNLFYSQIEIGRLANVRFTSERGHASVSFNQLVGALLKR